MRIKYSYYNLTLKQKFYKWLADHLIHWGKRLMKKYEYPTYED